MEGGSSTKVIFNLEESPQSIIMVAGVGGAGGNAINHMYDLGIDDVTFMVCNTDKQALSRSLVPIRVQLGEGLGAGNVPERGREAAIQSIDRISEIFESEDTKMVFITAGMGGGTGTGAAPIIAKAARDMDILTVGIVTMPYASEGPSRMRNAREGIAELKKYVDSLLIINNENIQEIYGELPITEAFGRANDILATAARGIAEIITRPGIVNVDFADVCTVMKSSGIALMGSAKAHGEGRARKVAEMALSSPLLNHNSVRGATSILFNITYGEDQVTLAESAQILDYIQMRAGKNANVIWGAGHNELLGEDIELTIIATGFKLGSQDNPLEPVVPIIGHNVGAMYGDDEPRVKPFQRPGVELGAADQKVVAARSDARHIKVDESSRYRNIDEIRDTPSYVRRNVELSRGGGAAKGSKIKLREEKEQSRGDVMENSLFDD